jgi:hypothetical protein
LAALVGGGDFDTAAAGLAGCVESGLGPDEDVVGLEGVRGVGGDAGGQADA